jgi:hypothetical protein
MSASQVARITGVSHRKLAHSRFLNGPFKYCADVDISPCFPKLFSTNAIPIHILAGYFLEN